MNLNMLDPGKCHFSKSEGGFLSLKKGEETFEDIKVYRSYPFSCQEEYICVFDKKGEEIGILRDLKSLDKETCKLILKDLEIRYFSPDITKINEIRNEYTYYYWDVITTAGPKNFTVKRGRGHIKMLENGYIMVIDVDGNRYMIKDIRKFREKHVRMIESLTT